ncbi:MAG: hypothetical protein ABSC36_06120 [Gaiellaceae bacterium]
MNLAQAQVVQGKSALTVTLGDTTIQLPNEVAARFDIAPRSGQAVILGIRREDIFSASRKSSAQLATMKAKIDRVEALGASVLGYFSVNAAPPRAAAVSAVPAEEVLTEAPLTGFSGTFFCATFEPRSMLRIGDSVEVAIDLERLHFFDPETDASLLREPAASNSKPAAKK